MFRGWKLPSNLGLENLFSFLISRKLMEIEIISNTVIPNLWSAKYFLGGRHFLPGFDFFLNFVKVELSWNTNY